jgi:hypothetical protein
VYNDIKLHISLPHRGGHKFDGGNALLYRGKILVSEVAGRASILNPTCDYMMPLPPQLCQLLLSPVVSYTDGTPIFSPSHIVV